MAFHFVVVQFSIFFKISGEKRAMKPSVRSVIVKKKIYIQIDET